jgi:hypothetical protein
MMEDNGSELEENGFSDEEQVDDESQDENDAIVHEKNTSESPRNNI